MEWSDSVSLYVRLVREYRSRAVLKKRIFLGDPEVGG
jgi:hypothetical protein